MNRFLPIAAAALLGGACTPHLDGLCSTNAQCRANETCSADGICLQGAAEQGGGDGGVTVSVSPDGGFVPAAFDALAVATPAAEVLSVTFELQTNAGAQLDEQQGTAQAGEWKAHVASTGYEGPAHLIARAVDKQSIIHSSQSTVQIDATPPTIATAWDGGVWAARDGGFTIDATVADARSGVQDATLNVLPSAGVSVPYPSQPIVGGVARFNVDANLAPAGAVTHMPFSLGATDRVGNQGTTDPTPQMVLNVDDEPPSISAAVLAGAAWARASAQLTATIGDGQGAGLAATSATLFGQTVQGVAGTFTFDTSGAAPFEGNAAYTITATDTVGNVGTRNGTIPFDNVPPAIGAISISDSPDYSDTNGAWYSASGTITLHAAIDAGTVGSPLDGGSVQASAGGASAGGSSDATGWSMSLPRSIGAGVEGNVAVGVSAADLAGNVATASANVRFDGVAPQLGAQLLAPAGWIARSAGPVTLSIACGDSGSGLEAVALRDASDAFLQPFALGAPCTTTWDPTAAPAGVEGPVALHVSATDHVHNSATQPVTVNVDDKPPSIPATVDTGGWHSGLRGSLSFSVPVAITDSGSGLSGAPALTGTGITAAWQSNQFQVTLPSDSSLETDSYPATISAQDAVGNPASRPMTFKIDNKAPNISGVSVTSAPDGNGYFAGPHVSPSGGTINISATIADAYLDAASVQAVVNSSSVATGVQQPGTNTWTFAIPRSVGANVNGPLAVHLNAKDLAGNSSSADATLEFDDTTSFNPAIGADTAWYARAALNIPLTFPTAPASGIKSVTIHCSNAPDSSGTFSANAWSVSLAAACATAGTEGPVSFSVTAVSNVGAQTAGTTAQRNIDDVAPTVTASISYPAADGGPLGYSNDGAHFNVRDTAVVIFHSYDCGAGLSSVSAASGYSASAPVDNGTTAACPSPLAAAHVYDITVQGAVSSIASQNPMDSTASVALTVNDAVTHATTKTQTVNVTRRLWQSGAIAATQLAKGPLLYTLSGTALTALQPSTGVTQWSTASISRAQAIAAGGTLAAPIVYVAAKGNTTTTPGVLYGYNASTGAAAGSNCSGSSAKTAGPALVAVATDGSGIAANGGSALAVCDPNTGICTEDQIGAIWQKTAAGCPWKSTTTNVLALAIGAGGRIYSENFDYSDTTDGITQYSVNVTPLGGSPGPSSASSGTVTQLAIGTDASGEFVLGDDLSRWTYGAGGLTNPWNVSLSAPFLIGSVVYGAGVSQVALSGGAVTATGVNGRPLAIDSAAGLYSASGNVIVAPQAMPALPGASITDAILDGAGTLYVSSNGQITAIATRAGPASGWSQPAKDQCRSSNLEFACPW